MTLTAVVLTHYFLFSYNRLIAIFFLHYIFCVFCRQLQFLRSAHYFTLSLLHFVNVPSAYLALYHFTLHYPSLLSFHPRNPLPQMMLEYFSQWYRCTVNNRHLPLLSVLGILLWLVTSAFPSPTYPYFNPSISLHSALPSFSSPHTFFLSPTIHLAQMLLEDFL